MDYPALLEEHLQPLRQMPSAAVLNCFNNMLASSQEQESRPQKMRREDEGAFSFPETLDKLLIIAVKNQYIKEKELLIKNNKDFNFVKTICVAGFKRRHIEKPTELMETILALWYVNVEIFCLNDVCQDNPDDHIVAAGSRKMVQMMKERNRLKLLIGEYTGDVVHEVKQYGL